MTKRTDRMVGFVLPCNKDGLPLYDLFLATSFEAIEHFFKSNEVSKYAYIYVAQCIYPAIPTFCLACVGSNISFTAKGGGNTSLKNNVNKGISP